jgi:hypothetical protein
MVRAKHTIHTPERLVAPGELLTLADPAAEARLIALGAADAVAPPAPLDPSDPSADPPQAPKGRRNK